MNDKIKYLHILSHPDVKFNPDFVKMINESGEFNTDEFLFITWHERVYEKIKHYDNVLFLRSKTEMLKWLFYSEWIFMHANCFSKLQIILLPKWICKKIIWRTWGHDIRPINGKRNIIKKILFKIYVKKINYFRAIGVANDIDVVNVQNIFGNNLETFKLNYSYKNDQKQIIEKIKSEIDEKKEVYILLGHNAGVSENHIENLYRLSKYSNENIKIIIPLSYNISSDDYVNEIKEKSINLFGCEKVEFIENFMEYYEYVKLINKCDIAIMDQEYSNGLGNLSLLIYFKKKIFVNKKGNIAQSFLNKKIIPSYTEEIGKIKFEEFIENKFDENLYNYIKHTTLFDVNASVNNFKKIINNL